MFICALCLCNFDNEAFVKLPYESVLQVLSSFELVPQHQEIFACKPCNRNFHLIKHLQALFSDAETKIEAYIQHRKEIGTLGSVKMEDVLAFLQGNLHTDGIKNELVCRICFQWVSLTDSTSLSGYQKVHKIIWPKLNIQCPMNPVVCFLCKDTLEDISNWIRKLDIVSSLPNLHVSNDVTICNTKGNNSSTFDNISNVHYNIESSIAKLECLETREPPSDTVPNTENESKDFPLQSENTPASLISPDEVTLELDINECFNLETHDPTRIKQEPTNVKSETHLDKTPTNRTLKLPQCKVILFRTDVNKWLKNNIKHDSNTNEETSEVMLCYHCMYKTRSKKSLLMHLNRNHKNRLFICFDCNFKAKIKDNLLTHIRRIHMKLDSYFCLQCSYVAKLPDDLRKHVKYMHSFNVEWFSCPYCEHKTKRKDGLKNHILFVHGNGKELSCLLCNFRTVYLNKLRSHLKMKHKAKRIERKFPEHKATVFHCSRCGCEHGTLSKEDISSHFKIIHGENVKTFQCLDCKYETRFKHNMESHIIHKYIKSDKILKCTGCSFETWYKHTLEAHIRDDHKILCCANCSYDTFSKNELKKHMKQEHLKKKQYYCDLCSYSTDIEDLFKRHWKKQHSKVHKCKKCSFVTFRKDGLQEHMRRHHNKHTKKLKCRYCDFENMVKDNIRKHEQRLHSTTVHKCLQCTYETNRKDSLLRHKRFKHK